MNAVLDIEYKNVTPVFVRVFRINMVETSNVNKSPFIFSEKEEVIDVSGTPIVRKLDVKHVDRLCLIYSSSAFSWSIAGESHGSLSCGGVVVVDSLHSFSYSLSQSGFVYFVYVERDFFDPATVELIINSERFVYSSVISYLFGGLDVCDEQISNEQIKYRLLSIVSLLASSVESYKVKCDEMDLFIRIKSTILGNALNANFYLEQAAALVCCSKSKLHNCLSRNGTTFLKLINKFRIEHFTEQLLLSPESNIDTLCYKSGFNDSGYAIKLFKKFKGVTPQRYRDRLMSIAVVSDNKELRAQYLDAKEKLEVSLKLYQLVVVNNIPSEIPSASRRVKRCQSAFEALYFQLYPVEY